MRILFMGTPEIAAGVLRHLSREHEVTAVFCRTDKPVGRKALLTPPPVKVAAQELGIRVLQPMGDMRGEAARLVRKIAPEIIVVVAYGRILPKEILEVPPCGCVNMHVSLLPLYRGAAPIQHALLNGERETGVSVMYMAEGLDTGDILAQRPIPIDEEDDAETLFDHAGRVGQELLSEVLCAIEERSAVGVAQDDTKATLAPVIRKEMGRFTFAEDARSIVNKVRAFCLWPCAFFEINGKMVKVQKARFHVQGGLFGTVLSRNPLTVAAKDGSVELVRVKPDGGRWMAGNEYGAGLRLKAGDNLYRIKSF